MGNKITNLPADVDSFLMNIAQMVELDGEYIDFGDIQKFAEKATTVDITEIREKMAELADLVDIDFEDPEDPEAEDILTTILNNVKGVSVC
jgi:tetrahydromethanopterin S-methyltransferase subunit B